MPHFTLQQTAGAGAGLTPAQVASGASAPLAVNTSGQLIRPDGTVLPTSGSAPSATTSTEGIVKLTGDLGGTSASPTVPGLANKQATLVSGTNIKTVGGTSLLGSGDVPLPTVSQATTGSVGVVQLAGDLAGTASAPTVPGLASKQPTLVSGVNIKTVGGTSILGSGDIPLPAGGGGGGVPYVGIVASTSVLNSTYAASDNPSAVALVGSAAPYATYRSDGTKWRALTNPGMGETRLVTAWSQVQTLHDELVAAGGGELHFIPGVTYIVPAGQGVTIDASYVGIQFNGAFINCSQWYGVNQAASTTGTVFTITGTLLGHTFPSQTALRSFENGLVYGSNTAASIGDWGPSAFRFDKTYVDDTPSAQHAGDTANANCILRRMQIIGFRRGLEYKSRAYFVRVEDSFITRCWRGIYTVTPSYDMVEKNTFLQCVLAEHAIAVDASEAAQLFTFNNCSFDYNKQFFNLNVGSKLVLNNCHLELSYGGSAGETLTPIVLSGADTGIRARDCNITYMRDATYNPAWASLITANNSSQVIDLEFNRVSGMGRQNNPTAFDTWCIIIGDVYPMIRIKADVQGISPNDVPAITSMGETCGVSGILRNGIGYPWGQLSPVTALRGQAAAVASVNVTENGVVRKGTTPKPMIRLQNNNPGVAKVVASTNTSGAANTGNPSFGTVSCGTLSGLYTVQFTSATAFTVYDPANASLGTGTLGTTFASGSLSFTATAGGTAAVSGDRWTLECGAQYYVSFPTKNFGARYGWVMFYNTQAVTSGAPLVKEMITTVAATYNGSTVSWVPAPFSPAYSNASGVSLPINQNWTKHSWKDHAPLFYPSWSSSTSSLLTLVIDLSGVVGPLYLSYFGFDVMSNSN